MREAAKILIKNEEIDGIKQYYVMIDKEEWKLETLMGIHNSKEFTQ